MATILPLMTASDLLELPDDGHRYDLLRGELITMSPAGKDQGQIALTFSTLFDIYVRKHKLGRTFAAETGFLIVTNPDTVLAPDVSFIRRDRMAALEKVHGFIPMVPDLIVEIISPSDRYKKVEEKIFVWLEAGTQVAITIDPPKRRIKVYRSQSEIQTLSSSDRLELPEIVPGWSVSADELFE